MKKTLLFSLLTLASSLLPLKAQTVYNQTNLKLPWGFYNLSMVDGSLYGCSQGLLFAGQLAPAPLDSPQAGTTAHRFIARLSPDTAFRHLDGKLSYIVRNPHDSLLYYTVSQNDRTRLYLQRGGKGPLRSAAVSPKGWDYDINHPAFSPDGRLMVFSASAPGGIGGYDLWCSRNIGNGWERPVNLGNRINTSGNEIHPVFYGNYLLFASNGVAPSDSSYSLYATGLHPATEDDQLIFHRYVVQRLPEPINSPADDWELALDPKHACGYWISTRNGHEEVFLFHGNLDGTMYWGQTLTADGKPLAGVSLTAFINGRAAAQTRSDADGRYNLFLQPGSGYTLHAQAIGHYSYNEPLPAARRDDDHLIAEVRHDLHLRALPIGKPIVIDSLFGPAADIDLTAQGRDRLMPIILFLRENPTLTAELSLQSYASSDTSFNSILNERRMNALRDYFQFNLQNTAQISFKNLNTTPFFTPNPKAPNSLKVIFVK